VQTLRRCAIPYARYANASVYAGVYTACTAVASAAQARIQSLSIMLSTPLHQNYCFLHKTQACKSGRYDRFWAAHLRTCPNFPPQAQDLLNRIFVEDPTRRASFKEILEHPWLQGEKWATADMHVSTVIHYILLVVQWTIFKTCMQALQQTAEFCSQDNSC
jgi:serine/threonine protein kinase